MQQFSYSKDWNCSWEDISVRNTRGRKRIQCLFQALPHQLLTWVAQRSSFHHWKESWGTRFSHSCNLVSQIGGERNVQSSLHMFRCEQRHRLLLAIASHSLSHVGAHSHPTDPRWWQACVPGFDRWKSAAWKNQQESTCLLQRNLVR